MEATFVFDNQWPPHPSWSKGQHFSVRDTRDHSLQRIHYSWGWRGKCCPKFNSVAHEGGRVRDLPSAGLGILVLVSFFFFLFSPLLFLVLAFFLLVFFSFLVAHSSLSLFLSRLSTSFNVTRLIDRRYRGWNCYRAEWIKLGPVLFRLFPVFFATLVLSPSFHSVFSLSVLIGSLAADQNGRGRKLLDIGSDDCDIKILIVKRFSMSELYRVSDGPWLARKILATIYTLDIPFEICLFNDQNNIKIIVYRVENIVKFVSFDICYDKYSIVWEKESFWHRVD